MKATFFAALLTFLCLAAPTAALAPNAGPISYADVRGKPYTVSYDHRAVLINGQRVLLQSAGMHYPRSSPSMWPQLMADSVAAGLNTMQTYVFHNYHEEVKGHWDWTTEHRNLSGFLQAAADAGMFVNLRIGPYVCAEWFYGGQPLWLHDSGFPFRDYNPGWTSYMADMMTAVVKYVEPYLARNGGPIIMTQIENEYGRFNTYVEWCGNLTRQLNTDTVWIMCQQPTPPAPIIPTCNGDDCSGYVQAQQANSLPAMWTEDWVAWFQHWGEPVPTRDSRNIAYDVASFFAKGGTYQNYYMWHGGTNFGRTVGGPNIITSYDYDAALDEYGVPHEPKYSHTAQLHTTLNKYSATLLSNNYSLPQSLGRGVELYSYGTAGSANSVVFLRNTGSTTASVKYQNASFAVAGQSVQIVDGATLAVQYDSNDISGISPSTWSPLSTTRASTVRWRAEPIGISAPNRAWNSQRPVEQVNATGYRTMYLWYSTQVAVNGSGSISVGLTNAGDHEHYFLGHTYIGTAHGADRTLVTSTFSTSVTAGNYAFNVLSITQGLENGAESALTRGLNGQVVVNGVDVTDNGWAQQVGLEGERYRWFNSTNTTGWMDGSHANSPMTWYQLDIATPKALGDAGWATWTMDMGGMGKGAVWVNGFMLGAYWSVKDSKGEYSQRYYHVPRDNLKPPGQLNNVVIIEEVGGDPQTVALIQRNQRTKPQVKRSVAASE